MLRIIEETSEGKGFALGSSLDDLAHEGARRMLVSALEAEVGEYVERYRSEHDEAGRFACPTPVRQQGSRRRHCSLEPTAPTPDHHFGAPWDARVWQRSAAVILTTPNRCVRSLFLQFWEG